MIMKRFSPFILFYIISVGHANIPEPINDAWDLEVRNTTTRQTTVRLKGPTSDYGVTFINVYIGKKNIVEEWYHELARAEFKNQKFPGYLEWLQHKYPHKFNKLNLENIARIREASQLKVNMSKSECYFLTDYRDEKITTYSGRYVMDYKGQLHINVNLNYDDIGNHSDFLKGEPVICSGTIEIRDGKVTKIDNCSGHYQPSSYHLSEAMAELEHQKVIEPGKCTVNFYDGKSSIPRSFGTLESFSSWRGKEFNDEMDEEKFFKEKKVVEEYKSFLTILTTKEVTPSEERYNLLCEYYSELENSYQKVDPRLKDMVWNSFLHMVSRFLYQTELLQGVPYDRFDSAQFSTEQVRGNSTSGQRQINCKIKLKERNETWTRFFKTSPPLLMAYKTVQEYNFKESPAAQDINKILRHSEQSCKNLFWHGEDTKKFIGFMDGFSYRKKYLKEIKSFIIEYLTSNEVEKILDEKSIEEVNSAHE